MNIAGLVRSSKKFAIDNSPALLTGVGVVGVVTTAVLTGKASIKAAEILKDRDDLYEIPATPQDKVVLVWKEFIPPVFAGVTTIVCIVGANRIGNSRAAAIAVAMSASEKMFDEYREKVVEKLGDRKEAEVRTELAQERVNRSGESTLVVETGTDVLCYEEFTGRYFTSSMETIRKAINDVNHQILHENYASLSDLYNGIGLERTKYSDDVGWKGDRMLAVRFNSVLSPEGRPCLAIDYTIEPVRDYYKTY